jgi:hypothetical protein
MKAARTPSLTSVSRNPTEDKRAVEGWHAPGRDGSRISLDALAALRADAPGQVLSLYLDADARRGAASTPGWQIQLKDELNALLEDERDRDAAISLARLGQWLLERVRAELAPSSLARSLAIFGTETPRRLEVLVLPQPLEPQSAWASEAMLEPLRRLENAYPRLGIAVLDAWHARLVTSWLGMVAGERALARSEDTDDWREMKGTDYRSLVAGGATQRDQFQRRMREHTDRWWRDLVPHIQRQARDEGWTALAVVADEHSGVRARELADAARLPLALDLRREMLYGPSSTIADKVARARAGNGVSATGASARSG